MKTVRNLVSLGLLIAGLFASNSVLSSESSVCATVGIEIRQELTLERQGFLATMKVSNELESIDLENLQIDVHFKNANGGEIVATSDTDLSDAFFYIRVDDLDGISAIDGTGVIESNEQGTAQWLIVPTAGAGGESDDGQLYFVGATLSYTYGAKEEVIEVAADTIVVKPQPVLHLDYFITQQVFADDPFTPQIEAPQPFDLGVRVVNKGFGSAKNLNIESAQPKIVSNDQGLAIDFNILSSQLEDQSVTPSLNLNFGDILSFDSKVARWVMETNLSGEFIEFSADFTHAKEYGGQLTSLIQNIETHYLIKRVKQDSSNKDDVLDFLVNDAGEYILFESEVTGENFSDCFDCVNVQNVSESVAVINHVNNNMVLQSIERNNAIYLNHNWVGEPIGNIRIIKAQRDNGSLLPLENVWLSEERTLGSEGYVYHPQINIFDSKGSNQYSIEYVIEETNQAPQIGYVGDKDVYENGQTGFLINVSDSNADDVIVQIQGLPNGAEFSQKNENLYQFQWFPKIGDAGIYPIVFTASDNELQTEMSLTVTVKKAGDSDADNMLDEWEQEHFGNLNQSAEGDFDGDGYSNYEEFINGTDPTIAESIPSQPEIITPYYAQEITSIEPELAIKNSKHADDVQVVYHFEIFEDPSLQTLVGSKIDVVEGSSETFLILNSSVLEQPLMEDTVYYWRARAIVEGTEIGSQWAESQFFYNTENNPPQEPVIIFPEDGAMIDSLTPSMTFSQSVDSDRDDVSYSVELYDEVHQTLLDSVSGISANDDQEDMVWVSDIIFIEDGYYRLAVQATDEHGLSSNVSEHYFRVSTENNAPTVPVVLYSDFEYQTVSVTLEFEESNDPEGESVEYIVQVANDSNFTSIVSQTGEPISLGQWDVASLDDNTRYYWRVKSTDGELSSSWVNDTFFINTENDAPSEIIVRNPANNSWVETLRPTIQVSLAIDIDEDIIFYELQLFNNEEALSPIYTKLSDSNDIKLDIDLSDNTHYWWKVRAVDEHGMPGEWTALNHFFVNNQGINDAPTLSFVLPTETVTTEEPLLLIQWSDQDPDSSANIDLYANDVLIASNIPEDLDADNDQFIWDTAEIEPGSYTLKAVLSDEENSVEVFACCDVIVPEREKFVLEYDSNVILDEYETSIAEVLISLKRQPSSNVTVNFSLKNSTIATILNDNSFIQFTPDNWDEPVTVRVLALDNCTDEDIQYEAKLQFDSVVSTDERFDGESIDTLSWLIEDNDDDLDASICDYQIIDTQNASGNYTYQLKPILTNVGVPRESISAVAQASSNYLITGEFEEVYYYLDTDEKSTSASIVTIETNDEYFRPANIRWSFTLGDQLQITKGDEFDNILVGSDVGEYINGFGGNDTISGGAGNDEIIGGSGSDQMEGGSGDDIFRIQGNDLGEDSFNGGTGFDSIEGSSQNDNIRIKNIESIERIDGKGGINWIYGTSQSDNLNFSATSLVNIEGINALADDDVVYGSQQDDVIIGGAGSDTLYGEAGDDIFLINDNDGYDTISGGEGRDELRGGNHNDIFRLTNFVNDFTVEVIDGKEGINNLITGQDNTGVNFDFRNTELRNIALIQGSNQEDIIRGNNQPNTIDGKEGFNKLFGLGGDDTFVISPNSENIIMGGADYDRIIGQATDDRMYLSNFNQDNSIELIDGQGGHNAIIGSQAADTIDFSATQLVAINEIDSLAGNDTVIGSTQNDIIVINEGRNALFGHSGDDSFLLKSMNQDNQISGGEGFDLIQGTNENDTLKFSIYNETYSVEKIDGLTGLDFVEGTLDGDYLDFSQTELVNISQIDGLSGDDIIKGSSQDNILIGGLGKDTLYGEGGNDVFKIIEGDLNIDSYFGGEGVDTLQGTAVNDAFIFSNLNQSTNSIEVIDGMAGENIILGTNVNDSIDLTGITLENINSINLDSGNDTLIATPNNDVVYLGLGSDNVTLGDGDDAVYIEAGDNIADVLMGGEGFDTIFASNQDDIIAINMLEDSNSIESIDGLSGYNILAGDDTSNTLDVRDIHLKNIHEIDGKAGNDIIHGTSNGDIFKGGLGSDEIYGYEGDDTFIHTEFDESSNRYIGGSGNDQVLGTSSNDTFIFDQYINDVETINGKEGDNIVQGTDEPNRLDFSTTSLINIQAIASGSGDDFVTGSNLPDMFIVGSGNNQLYGNDGDDVFQLTADSTGVNIYSGGNGTDKLVGTPNNDQITFASFNGEVSLESIDGLSGFNVIQGNEQDNILNFKATNLTNIDEINGQGGNDKIKGSIQDNVIIGGPGDDELRGKEGDDTYVWRMGDGDDLIRDQGSKTQMENDEIIIDADISPRDLWLRVEDGDLKIYVLNTPDVITCYDCFSKTQHKIATLRIQDKYFITHDGMKDLSNTLTWFIWTKPDEQGNISLLKAHVRIFENAIKNNWQEN